MRNWMFGSLLSLVTVAMLVAVPTGAAKDRDVRVQGACTGASTAKLKLSAEDGRIEAEFEVDQNRNGVRWNLVVSRNGAPIARLARVTKAPSGSFEARVLAPNRAGVDRITARATRAGESCSARASF
jgi:hypothetical protein